MLARTLELFGTYLYISLSPSCLYVFLKEPSLFQTTTAEPWPAPLMIILWSSFKLYKTSRSSFCCIVKSIRGNLIVYLPFFQTAKRCLYDEVIEPMIFIGLNLKAVVVLLSVGINLKQDFNDMNQQ